MEQWDGGVVGWDGGVERWDGGVERWDGGKWNLARLSGSRPVLPRTGLETSKQLFCFLVKSNYHYMERSEGI